MTHPNETEAREALASAYEAAGLFPLTREELRAGFEIQWDEKPAISAICQALSLRDYEKKRADKAEAELDRLKAGSQWHPIETIANLNPESLVLASCHADDEFPDGRVMIWKVRILLDNIRRGNSTPEHLRYPASHWTPLPTPPEGV